MVRFSSLDIGAAYAVTRVRHNLAPMHANQEHEMSRSALILVDIQNDYFPGGKWPLVGADAAADNAARVLQASRKAGDLVVHIRHEFTSDDAPFFTPGSEGANLHPKVANLPDENVLLKHFPNSFRETRLHELLKNEGVENVTVVGSMSHMCIDATTRAAADLGYKVRVVHDACATKDLEFNGTVIPAAQAHAAYMAALGFAYAEVVSTDALIG
jgi:nicotinamidase-related amidase